MRYIHGIAAILLAGVVLTSCSESTDPSGDGQVVLQTQFTSSTVTSSIVKGGDETQGFPEIDSVRIDSVRILLSRIKLHRDDEDTNDNVGRNVKTGPALIVWARGGLRTAFAVPVPNGKYNKVKLEMHKFSGSEAKQYENDPVFRDFATDKDRVTLIVNGTKWQNGDSTSFTLTSDRTENLWMKVEPYFEVTSSSTSNIVLDFDPVEIFRVGGRVLDPADLVVKASLEAKLKNILRLRRK
jgi:hypothetical protein